MPQIFNESKFFRLGENAKTTNWIVEQVKRRFRDQKNLLLVITGETGGAKSYTGLRLGQCFSKAFNVPFAVDQVLFNPLRFFPLMRTLPTRSTIMFDEGSLTLDAQKWQTVESKLLGYVTETFRFKQYILIICAPDLGMINGRVRRCTHALIRMYGTKGEEGRVYKLIPTQLGAQYLKGIGTLRHIVLPDYEYCQRPSCRKCEKYKTCDLLRGQYERKKEEAFNELLDYTEFRISQIPFEKIGSGSPYGFKEKMQRATSDATTEEREEYGEDVIIDDDDDNADSE